MQATSNLLMIRPVAFGFNEQTAGSNAFQIRDTDQQQVQTKAAAEFDGLVNILKDNKVNVIVIDDTAQPHTPDAIFPNNWVSFHDNGDVFLYPMQAENRRLERREDIITQLEDNFRLRHVTDLSHFEQENRFLEGTGSMVLDRESKIAYACLSPRTNEKVLAAFCGQSGYTMLTFHAVDENGLAIYHTNVMMAMGSNFAVICLDSIQNSAEKELVIKSLKSTGKEIISISFDQMSHFAGNMLEVKNTRGDTLIVMSLSAYQSLTYQQKAVLSAFGKLVYADIGTIETNGGGSARCMIAEVHLPQSGLPA
ncbi:citrulline utilization hydrolase CtlX [Mucilaginibacter sp. UR6-11]|uniref:citrulline utilization hydrolase CtlX n=1 Tax=Mucilaginibacter sp. UR6-11 TaxID=1435644 RepID=UPI001E507D58|nr:arginine deiminase-related protein [Mucilaginibacter sp. UR6-11]MCC8426259.1 arginine deiminase-related protein [Mucilaginibacter sp. UR6-11]